MVYRLSQLTKVYGARTVLNIPKLEIESGHIYALLGPNGAGKTTLLNVLGAIDHTTSGKIKVLDYELTKMNKKDKSEYRRKIVGFVFQFLFFFSTFEIF